MRWRTVLWLEAKVLLSSRSAVAALAVFLAAGVAAIAFGRSLVREQHRVLASAAAADAADFAYFQQAYAGKQAGHVAYYARRTIPHEPSDWAAVSVGQRDLSAYALRIGLLGLESQLYDAEPGNPSARLAGPFDLAFVIAIIAPLLLIALGYGALGDDEEGGRLRLVRAQGASVGGLLALRLGLRTAVVLGLVLALLAAAIVWVPLPFDRRALDAALVAGAYLLCWGGAVALVVAAARRAVTAALALLGLWLATAVVGPAVANAAIERLLPVPQGLELTVRQRLAVHDGWDRPRDTVLNPFLRRRPEWARHEVPRDRFSWAWYYANWEAGDLSVQDLARQYRENLLARQRWSERLALLMPPVHAGLALNRLAQTDLRQRVAYLDSVRAFHEQWKAFFYPRVFADATMRAADYDGLPRHRFAPPWTPLPVSGLAPFLLGALATMAASAGLLRRRLRSA